MKDAAKWNGCGQSMLRTTRTTGYASRVVAHATGVCIHHGHRGARFGPFDLRRGRSPRADPSGGPRRRCPTHCRDPLGLDIDVDGMVPGMLPARVGIERSGVRGAAWVSFPTRRREAAGNDRGATGIVWKS